jgi:uncharacterized protein YdeI (YjbR/CyaY-like superfamily)
MVRFTDVAQVSACSDTLGSYLTEAMAYAAAGVRPPMIQIEIETPIELTEALLSDPELAEAFYRLTPGRQRGYLLNLNAAKRPVTRLARLAKFRAHILAGKGPLER